MSISISIKLKKLVYVSNLVGSFSKKGTQKKRYKKQHPLLFIQHTLVTIFAYCENDLKIQEKDNRAIQLIQILYKNENNLTRLEQKEIGKTIRPLDLSRIVNYRYGKKVTNN